MAEPKKTKEEVDYSRGKGTSRCFLCQHFKAPNSCEKVEGRIGEDMWCKLFRKAR